MKMKNIGLEMGVVGAAKSLLRRSTTGLHIEMFISFISKIETIPFVFYVVNLFKRLRLRELEVWNVCGCQQVVLEIQVLHRMSARRRCE